MTTMRTFTVLAAMSLATTLGGFGMTWLAVADAASPAQAPAACAADDRGFRELLETVRTRATDLDRREADLATREAGLAAVKQTVTGEITRLEGIATALGLTGGGVSIARVYDSMGAEDAARILNRLDDATLRAVLSRMRERQVGAILAAMSDERAVAVTKAFVAPGASAR